MVGAGPTLIGEEELRIGAIEGGGPDSFGLIRSIAVLEDGRFAVADVQGEEVRLFGREGRHLGTFGGEGQGPGELGRSTALAVGDPGGRSSIRLAERSWIPRAGSAKTGSGTCCASTIRRGPRADA